VFHDVLVLHATDRGWLCQIQGAAVFVARAELDPDTVMPAVGERGIVTVHGYAGARIRNAIRR